MSCSKCKGLASQVREAREIQAALQAAPEQWITDLERSPSPLATHLIAEIRRRFFAASLTPLK